jgi:hypothetical protein
VDFSPLRRRANPPALAGGCSVKRLESGGYPFLLSIYRHIMRNYVYIYALQNGLEIPIGQHESSLRFNS